MESCNCERKKERNKSWTKKYKHESAALKAERVKIVPHSHAEKV